MNKLLLRLCLAWPLAICAGIQAAHGAGEDNGPLRINGFGTIGLTHIQAPEGWYFRRDAAQYPSDKQTSWDTDSRLGLQAHYEVSPRLELVSQVVLKRRLHDSKPLESLEWLFASYKPTGDVTLRVGRTNPDMFLLSDYRNVGVAYPWVRPNLEIYSALPLYTIDGADASYVWTHADTRWRAKTFVGNVNARATLAYSPEQLNFKLKPGGGLILTRESGGLLIRSIVFGARMSVDVSERTRAAGEVLRQLRASGDPTVAGQASELYRRLGLETDTALFAEVGVSYELDGWLWSAEYAKVRLSTGTRNAQSAYVSVGRRLGDFTLFGMMGRSVSDLPIQETPDWSGIGPQAQNLANSIVTSINSSRARQTSLTLGTRWDFHQQMALKVQWDHFWISRAGSSLWVGSSLEPARPDVFSASLDFTF